jgi:hypothetical protein
MSESVADRRTARRYTVDLRVELSGGEGITRDVSSGGVFFETDQSLSPGAPLRFSMVLKHADPVPLRLACEGEIVRVEWRDGKLGVAASITSQWLEPYE